MNREELDLALDWAAAEGWNPGFYDADCFYNTDPNGFFIGTLGNEPISAISAVAYDKHFGFLGFYIVKPEYRGYGYGLQIWKRAIEYLNTQNIGLDGVVAQQQNYKKSGFKLAYRNMRYRGFSKKNSIGNDNVIKLSDVPFEKILDYDSKLFPTARSGFLKCWINQLKSAALGSIINGYLQGYGVIRKCRKGYKIGPLFADNLEIANKLFLALINNITTDSEIFLDLPETNFDALKLAYKYNLKFVFETARMYTKSQPSIDLKKVFGVTTFELG